MMLKITMAILLQGLTLYLLSLSCDTTSLGMSVIVEPLEESLGSTVRAHFTAIVPNPCPDFTGVCADGEDCETHLTSKPFTGSKPASGWCARQWSKTVSSNFNGTVSLGSSDIYVYMNAEPVIRTNNGKRNQPPYVCLPPPLRARVSCPHHINLSVRDMDGDKVRCRFADGSKDECLDCTPHSFIELDEDECTLTFNGKAAEGQYFIYLMAEDRIPAPSGSPLPMGEPLSAVPVHLSLTVEAFSGRCSDEPLAQSSTPAENIKFDILPFQQVKFPVAFESQTESILEVAVVGPFDLQTANFAVVGTLAELTIARVRHVNNNSTLPRLLPISFAANTESLQSEPRCVWLEQRNVAPAPLGTELECEDTQMNLVLPLDSLASVDVNELKLNDPLCPISHNSTHLTAQISFTGCGTDIVHAESELIYFNILQSKNTNSVITRKPILQLPLACRIPAVLAKGPQIKVDMPTELETFGEVKVEINVTIPDLTNREGRQEEASRLQALDVKVLASSSSAERAEITVTDCIESETEDFAVFRQIVENGCMTSTNIEVMPSSSSMSKTYRISLGSFENQGTTMYVRCTANLCLPTMPSDKCPDPCTSSRNGPMVVSSLITKSYVVNSGAISLMVTTPAPTVTTPAPTVTVTTPTVTTNTTSHAPEQASTVAAGAILTTISIFLQNLLLY